MVLRNPLDDTIKIYRNVHTNSNTKNELKEFLQGIDEVVGHNFFMFDLGVLKFFDCWPEVNAPRIIDTLVISRLLNYKQDGGHGLERWGTYFKYPKDTFSNFSEWSQELEDRCIVDTKINALLYNLFKRFLDAPDWQESIELEHRVAHLCLSLHQNGFPFDIQKATSLLNEITQKVQTIEGKFSKVFLPKNKLVREVTPTLTQKGTLNAKDFRWLTDGDLSNYRAGSPFSLFERVPFNPRSSTLRIEILNEAGWKPVNKTKGHTEALRNKDTEALERFKVYGWKCDEENLATLPDSAPEPARLLSEYLLLSSRMEDLVEWIGLYREWSGSIHGTFSGIGSWTHRKSHQKPNMANIPALVNRKGLPQPYGEEFRSCWISRKDHVLVGCDAEGIQLRVFSHYCNDQKLIHGIVSGDKREKTDIHSVNMSILNRVTLPAGRLLCNGREVAKTYIYALLLGAASGKQSEILGCSVKEAAEGLERILEFYPGWKKLKETVIPADAARGYFVGFDGRKVLFPSAHHILAGYLQNGESVIMKKASILWHEELSKRNIPFTFRNDVHDEWQTETTAEHAEAVGAIQAQSIVDAGVHFKLSCPLAGKSVTGKNWAETH